jgi:hypothetical protein
MMADGVNALTRLYKNNFLDRDRQALIGAAMPPAPPARPGGAGPPPPPPPPPSLHMGAD